MKIPVKILFVGLSLVLAFSCEEGLYTVFDSVVNDNLIDDNALDNELYVMAMTIMGTDYYIACGDLRRRPVAGSDWTRITVPSGNAFSVATDGSEVFVSIIYNNGTGAIWNQTTSTIIDGATITGLKNVLKVKYVGTSIIASIQMTDDSFSLYNVSTASTIASGLSDSINDFAENNTYVAGNAVYRDATPITPTDGEGLTYLSVYYASNGRYYLGTTNGRLFESAITLTPSSTDWTIAPKTYTYYQNGREVRVRFSTFENLDPTTVAVGTQGTGFYTIDNTYPIDDAVDRCIKRFGDSAKKDLYEGAIEDIYADGTTVFFCTMHAGLWRNTWNGIATGWGETWTRE